MPKIYKRNCNWCGIFYRSTAQYYCSNSCATKDKHDKGILNNSGRPAWNKGIHGIYTSPMKGKKTGRVSSTSFKKGHQAWNKGKKLPEYSGSKHPGWKTGKTKMSNGYISMWIAPGIRQLEHRYVVEKEMKRKLKVNEHVHHINGDKTDNRIENLKVLTSNEHGHIHAVQQWKKGGILRNRHN